MQIKRRITSAGILIATLLGIFSMTIPTFAQTGYYGTATTASAYCPQFSRTVSLRSSGSTVLELQKFLSDYYNVAPTTIQTGYFGRITQSYVVKFQQEKGLPAFGVVGSLTRTAITKACGVASGTTSSSCPLYQTPLCPFGQHVQQGTLDSNGCQSAPTCVTDSVGTFGTSCPSYQIPLCPAGQHAQQSGIDSNGCQSVPTCVTDSVTSSCPVYQSPLCPTGQHAQQGALDSNGCQSAPTCVKNSVTSTGSCPLYQTPICGAGQYVKNGATDSNGCAGAPYCVNTPTN